MPTAKLTLEEFPPVDYQTWRASVETDLQGAPFEKKLVSHTYEGIDILPVYTRQDQLAGEDPTGFPGQPPFVRGARPLGSVIDGTDLRQEHAHPDLEVTNRAILSDLQGGVTSLILQLDQLAKQGLPIDDSSASVCAGQGGIMLYDVNDFDSALAGVELNLVDVALDAGAAFLPAAASLAALWKRRGFQATDARGAWNADPLAALARGGQLPTSPAVALQQLADLAHWTAEYYPQVTAVGVDTAPYHDAGATAAQDIAFAVGTAVEYLRAMTAADMSVEEAASQILFRISLGTHHFLAIAKIRALRQVWWRVIDASQKAGDDRVGDPQPVFAGAKIHARTSNRVLTQRDPYVNLLRNSVSVFAAMIGGADAITSVPFDHAAQLPDEFSRRIARNTVLVLQEESHLNRVVDPAGGSWFIERITRDLAEKAWSVFQDIEGQGGMLATLESGWVADQIDAAYAPRAADIAFRKEGITGVSEFPNLGEPRELHPPPDVKSLAAVAGTRHGKRTRPPLTKIPEGLGQVAACVVAASEGATVSQIATALGFHTTPSKKIKPLETRSFAQPFEELRDASDAWCAIHGERPRVFLANMGPISHHTARATYAKNFFEAGGFEVIGNDGFPDTEAAVAAARQSRANIVAICSSDKLYPDVVPPLAAQLKEAGVRTVILAGHPGDHETAWRQAGVDRFIFMKCNVLAILQELLTEEKVLSS